MDEDGYNIKNIGSLELEGEVVLGEECDQKYIGTFFFSSRRRHTRSSTVSWDREYADEP